MRIDRHESAAQVTLLPFDGVERTHDRIHHASVVGEYLHLTRSHEGSFDGVLTCTGTFHRAVTVRLAHRAVHDAVYLRLGKRTRERSVLFLLQFFEERFLLCLHVFADSLFRVTLHSRIDGGIDLQAVLVDVVLAAIRFAVLLAETVQWVILPLP